MILPILDYGSFIYSSAINTKIKTIETVHNTGLRLCTGAFRTSQIDALLVDAGSPP